jgi:hypothetical protein
MMMRMNNAIRMLAACMALGALAGWASAETAGGLSWTAPAGWKSKPQQMRAANYVIPAAGGDGEDGECGVYFFGAGQGGSVEANVQRWIGQFRAPGGGPADGLAKRSSETINGVKVTTVDVTGTYMFKAFPMAREATPKPGYRMLAAIAEGPEGPIFFKLTAPKATADGAEKDFRKMLGALAKH